MAIIGFLYAGISKNKEFSTSKHAAQKNSQAQNYRELFVSVEPHGPFRTLSHLNKKNHSNGSYTKENQFILSQWTTKYLFCRKYFPLRYLH